MELHTESLLFSLKYLFSQGQKLGKYIYLAVGEVGHLELLAPVQSQVENSLFSESVRVFIIVYSFPYVLVCLLLGEEVMFWKKESLLLLLVRAGGGEISCYYLTQITTGASSGLCIGWLRCDLGGQVIEMRSICVPCGLCLTLLGCNLRFCQ